MPQHGERNKTALSDLPKGSYEAIFGHSGPTFSGREVLRFGTARRVQDARNIRGSLSVAVPLDQAGEFTAKYGHLGVKWVPDGDVAIPVYNDRNSRIRTLHAIGCHDVDETRNH
jgi:hypothetical protein